MMVDKISCSSCNEEIDRNLDKCPSCGFQLNEVELEEPGLPDFDYIEKKTDKSTNVSTELDSQEEPVAKEPEEPGIPDFDYIEKKTDKSTNISTELDSQRVPEDKESEEPGLPDFDYIEKKTDKSTNISTELDSQGVPEDKESEEPGLPDFDYIEGKSDKSTNVSTELDTTVEPENKETDEPGLPDFDYIEGKSEKSTNISTELDTVEQDVEKTVTEEDAEKEAMLADLDEILGETTVDTEEPIEQKMEKVTEETQEEQIDKIQEPSTVVEPDQSEQQKIETIQEVEEEEEIIEEEMYRSLSEVPIKTLLWVYGSQVLYWSFTFFVIMLLSARVTSQNIRLESLKAVDYELGPEGFVFGWIIFFVMGWFHSYKLKQIGINTKLQHGILYLVIQTIGHIVLMAIGLLILNPMLLFNEFQRVNYVYSSYLLLGIYAYIMYLLTSGFLFFFAGYRIFWNEIYERMPMSDIHPEIMYEQKSTTN